MKKSINVNATPVGSGVKELTEEQALGLRNWSQGQVMMIVRGYDQLALEQRTNEPTLKYTSRENLVDQLMEMIKPEYVSDVATEVEEWLTERLDELKLNTERQDPLEIFDEIEEAVDGLICTIEFN